MNIVAFQVGIAYETRSAAILFLTMGIIYIISIVGMRQPAIFTQSLRRATEKLRAAEQQADPLGSEQAQAGGAVKYKKSNLTEDESGAIWQRLQTLMDERQLYRDNELSLPDLAEAMEVKLHDLSQVINSRAGMSFFEFINRYRVEAAMQLLSDSTNDHRKVLDIAMDVGFNSQSTFYAHFKKQCGKTPNQYRKGTPAT